VKRIIASIRQRKRSAGPFGYEMGQKVEGEPHYTMPDGTYTRIITHNVPAPFMELHLTYTPNAGLCGIMASVDTDAYDAQFSKLRGMLTAKYGKPIAIEEERLVWGNVNVDNIGEILLVKEPASELGTPIVAYAFTNLRDCLAEAKTIRQEKQGVGPFGYAMGQKIEGEPDYTDPFGMYVRRIEQNVPAPFTRLELGYTPRAGLSNITAVVTTDDYEVQFSKLRAMLAEKYGEPTYMDNYSFEWRNVNVDDIDRITLPYGYGAPMTAVIYVFTNYWICNAEAEAMRQKKGDAGPLGYEMGQKIEGEPDGVHSDGTYYKFITQNLPAPYKVLFLMYTPNAGLCGIVAYVDTDDYEAQFPKLRSALTDKYGEPVVDNDGDLRWFSVNVDNIAMLMLPKEPAGERVAPIVIYFPINALDSQAKKAEAILEKLRDLL